MLTFKLIAVILGALAAAAGAVTTALWGPRARARARLRGGVSHIVDRAIVTVTGTVRAPTESLVAPLSGRPCVLYESFGKIYELRGRYMTLVDNIVERKMIGFELELAGGETVTVDGDAADLEMPPDPVIPRKISLETAFAARYGHDAKRARNSGFEETVVAPDDRISVQGMALIENDLTAGGERGYRENAPIKVRLVAHDAHPLTIGRPQ